jgi:GntR family transcriptional regulator, gluconate operon transcriptional repressor
VARQVRVGSLGERLTEDLRIRIVRGRIPAGERLVEDNLATEYDVSRGPVRDALRVLAQEGLLTQLRQGFVVRGISAEDVRELYAARAALEGLAIRTVSARPPDEIDWAATEAALAAMRAAADAADWHEFSKRDLEFHSTFYECAQNSRLRGLWEVLRPSFAAMFEVTAANDLDLRPSWEDHVRLRDLVRTGKTAVAEAYLATHLEGSQQRMIRALTESSR